MELECRHFQLLADVIAKVQKTKASSTAMIEHLEATLSIAKTKLQKYDSRTAKQYLTPWAMKKEDVRLLLSSLLW